MKKYIKPEFKIYTFEPETEFLGASPNEYQQGLLDKHPGWHWDEKTGHVRNNGGIDKCGSSEYRNNLWDD